MPGRQRSANPAIVVTNGNPNVDPSNLASRKNNVTRIPPE
jgi:hypothetical protein